MLGVIFKVQVFRDCVLHLIQKETESPFRGLWLELLIQEFLSVLMIINFLFSAETQLHRFIQSFVQRHLRLLILGTALLYCTLCRLSHWVLIDFGSILGLRDSLVFCLFGCHDER